MNNPIIYFRLGSLAVAARQPIRSHIALTRPHCHPGRGSLLQSRIGTPYKALLKGLMFLHTKPLSPDQSGWPIFRYIFSMHWKGLTSILINVNVHAQPTHYKDPRKRATCIFFKIVYGWLRLAIFALRLATYTVHWAKNMAPTWS